MRPIKKHYYFPERADVSIRAKIVQRTVEVAAEEAAAAEAARMKALEPPEEKRVSRMPYGPNGELIPASYRHALDEGDDPSQWAATRLQSLVADQEHPHLLVVSYAVEKKIHSIQMRSGCTVCSSDDAADPFWNTLNVFERELIVQAQMLVANGVLRTLYEDDIRHLYDLWAHRQAVEHCSRQRIALHPDVVAAMST